MKGKILVLVLLLSSSMIAMERAKKVGEWSKTKAGAMYAKVETDVRGLSSLPADAWKTTKGLPGETLGMAREGCDVVVDTVTHPRQTLDVVTDYARTTAKWSALLFAAGKVAQYGWDLATATK